MSKPGLAILMAAAIGACGPSIRTQARPYVVRSPHRSVVVFPFDWAGGARNGSPQATSSFAAKLAADGFLLVNQAKARTVYDGSALKRGSFNALADAAQFGSALGGKAVLLGSVDDAYDRVERRPPVFGRDARGRRILLEPSQSYRWAGLSLRVKLIDAGTGAVLWASAYSGRLGGVSLSTVADQVTDVLNQELLEAIEQKQF